MLLALAGCDTWKSFQKQNDATFGDQNFKSAIALIELHKTRNGKYPESLQDLQFLGQWDAIWINAVQYKKVDRGYELNLVRGWVGEPELNYPPEFWKGLGIAATNVKGGPSRKPTEPPKQGR